LDILYPISDSLDSATKTFTEDSKIIDTNIQAIGVLGSTNQNNVKDALVANISAAVKRFQDGLNALNDAETSLNQSLSSCKEFVDVLTNDINIQKNEAQSYINKANPYLDNNVENNIISSLNEVKEEGIAEPINDVNEQKVTANEPIIDVKEEKPFSFADFVPTNDVIDEPKKNSDEQKVVKEEPYLAPNVATPELNKDDKDVQEPNDTKTTEEPKIDTVTPEDLKFADLFANTDKELNTEPVAVDLDELQKAQEEVQKEEPAQEFTPFNFDAEPPKEDNNTELTNYLESIKSENNKSINPVPVNNEAVPNNMNIEDVNGVKVVGVEDLSQAQSLTNAGQSLTLSKAA
jgi:hypothetical protein